MTERSHRADPLTPPEREELEGDLISFSDRELDRLGDVRGLDVLYAGGASPLWLEGLSQRTGVEGTVTAIDLDAERIGEARVMLEDAALAAPVRLVVGSVYEPSFGPGTFDLAYSAGLLHELDVSVGTAGDALRAIASVVRNGGRMATSDFVDSVPALQLEDERIQGELAREASGSEYFGIGPPERLVSLHESLLDDVRWSVSAPHEVRHLGKLVLAEGASSETRAGLGQRREVFLERVRREGYSRPATLYVEGVVAGSRPAGS